MTRSVARVAALLVLVVAAGSASAATVFVRSDGKLIVNEEPFFPFGFFANVGDPLRDLDAVGTNGFNTIHCNNKCNDAFYARAAELGVYVFAEIWWQDPQISVQSSRDRLALLAYYVVDEMNYEGSCSSPRYKPGQVAARSSLIKSYDRPPPAQHPTTGSLVLDPRCEVAAFAGAVDILQGFNYPIGNWGPSSTWLEVNAQAIKMLVDGGGGRTVIADGQSFAWPGQRYPTAAEALNMNYAALALGVSGIMMYSISEPDSFLPTAAPALWNELKAQAREIRALSDMLLNGRRTPLDTGQPYIYASAWTRGGRTLVIVVNTDRSNTRTVNLRLPADSSRSLTPAFARLPGSLAVDKGVLTGSVQAEKVNVYINAEGLSRTLRRYEMW